MLNCIFCGTVRENIKMETDQGLYKSIELTEPDGFTYGIEGPACDINGTLYAVNYGVQGTIGMVTPAGEAGTFITLPEGSIGNGIRFNRAGHMMIADYKKHNILRVDVMTKKIDVFAHDSTMNQPNDIAIGANDMIYASDPSWSDSTGKLWRIDTNGQVTLLEENMGTTNGIEVSTDEKTLYVNESIQRNIWAYDLSAEGRISNKRLLTRFPDFGLDGMRCDAEGNLYVTRYGKGTILILSPSGTEIREIQLKGERPSNIAFGGPDGRTCYVTMADRGNIESFRTEYPGRSWLLLNTDESK
jgi:sugar lactone lactonase YvrE